jgi:hypothetical protein
LTGVETAALVLGQDKLDADVTDFFLLVLSA